jgi:hypothetical protein
VHYEHDKKAHIQRGLSFLVTCISQNRIDEGAETALMYDLQLR